MTITEAVTALNAEILVGFEKSESRIECFVASDLMSDVLLVDADNMLLITSLASDQVLRTAQIVGAAGVVVVNGKTLPATMAGVASNLGMPLLISPMSKYDACVALYKAQQSAK